MSSTNALRKASTVLQTETTQTKNLLPYEPHGLRDVNAPEMPEGWQRCWVLKFGGSSVGQRLPRVIESILEHIAAANEPTRGCVGPASVAVVVSAMGKTTDMLLDAAAIAKEGDLQDTEEVVAKIRTLAVSNSRSVLEHFEVAESERESVLEAVAREVDITLAGLADFYKGVSLLRDLSPRTLDAILSNGERVSAAVIAKVLDAVVRHGNVSKNRPASVSYVKPMCVEATSFMATDDTFGQAKVDFDTTRKQLISVCEGWPEFALPVFTGFIGRSTVSGSITTLGRNGSDYSAALIAAALRAEQVIINTDVPGVFTADPRIVADAFPVPEMSYSEAIDLSIYGSKIFHPKTMLPLMRHSIPMVIRNTNDAPGAPSTKICDPPAVRGTSKAPSPRKVMRAPSLNNIPVVSSDSRRSIPESSEDSDDGVLQKPKSKRHTRAADADLGAVCVASLEDLSFLTVRAEVSESLVSEVAAQVMDALKRANITGIWSDQRTGNDVSILVRRGDREQASNVLLQELKGQRLTELSATEPVTLLSLVPKANASRGKASARFFQALDKASVKIHRVVCGASTSSISCLIDGVETALAVRIVHSAFNFARRIVSTVVLGDTQFSRGLLGYFQRNQASRKDQGPDMDIRVCAVLTTAGCVLPKSSSNGEFQVDSQGISLSEVLGTMGETLHSDISCDVCPSRSWREHYEYVTTAVLPVLRRLPVPILVDCNRFIASPNEPKASVAMAVCYQQCLLQGIRVVVSNPSTVYSMSQALQLLTQGPTPALQTGDVPGGLETPVETLHRRRGLMRYGSCVGAGLPLLETIREQLASGKRVCRVEGSLSATISLIVDRISRSGDTLRQACETAQRLQITEPHIGSDLSGDDVINKMRVVAFALGCELKAENIKHTPLVPNAELPSKIGSPSELEAVFEAIDAFDKRESLSQRATDAFKANKRWRYMATLEIHSKGVAALTVGVKELNEDHFAFAMRGKEVACALWQESFEAGFNNTEPDPMLVMRVQGAGPTSGEGVLADVVRLVGS